MKAEEILNKYIKGELTRDYNKVDLKNYTVTIYTALSAMKEFAEHQNKKLIEENKKLKAHEYMNDFITCDICGNHPSVVIRTEKGTFCQEHVKY